jgi:hydroxyacylglutathione hydrolase
MLLTRTAWYKNRCLWNSFSHTSHVPHTKTQWYSTLYLSTSKVPSEVNHRIGRIRQKDKFTVRMTAHSHEYSTIVQGGDTTNSHSLVIERVPVLKDNYCWILHDPKSGATGVVDPAEKEPIMARLAFHGWTLTHILNTHHHWDHTGANLELKKAFNNQVTIVGPKADADRIPGIDVELQDGDVYSLGDGIKTSTCVCFDTPGHTKGHVTYYFEDSKALFPGDTLFSMGCGRLFEGTPEQMWNSLQKLVGLPDDTKVFCAHEYTLSNAMFAVHVDPTNKILEDRKHEVEECRRQGIPTIPTVLSVEKETNPFLRPWSQEIRASLNIPKDASDAEAFGVIRRAKDSF